MATKVQLNAGKAILAHLQKQFEAGSLGFEVNGDDVVLTTRANAEVRAVNASLVLLGEALSAFKGEAKLVEVKTDVDKSEDTAPTLAERMGGPKEVNKAVVAAKKEEAEKAKRK